MNPVSTHWSTSSSTWNASIKTGVAMFMETDARLERKEPKKMAAITGQKGTARCFGDMVVGLLLALP